MTQNKKMNEVRFSYGQGTADFFRWVQERTKLSIPQQMNAALILLGTAMDALRKGYVLAVIDPKNGRTVQQIDPGFSVEREQDTGEEPPTIGT